MVRLLEPYIGDVVVGVECMHCWYWVSDFCQNHKIDFVLGHALYMKAIHGGKAKNDKIDSYKIASLLKGGNFPLAYNYPKEMRATRDLLRRRTNVVRHSLLDFLFSDPPLAGGHYYSSCYYCMIPPH